MLSEEETRLRYVMVTALRMLTAHDLDDPMAGVLTVRAPARGRFLTSPMGVSWGVVQPDELVVGDRDALFSGKAGPINKPAVANNLGVLDANAGMGAVMHMHAPASVALGLLGRKLAPFCQEACRFFESQSIVEDRFDFDDADRPAWLGRSIGTAKILLIRNHGLMTQGEGVEDAVAWAIQFEQLSETQLRVDAAGGAGALIPDEAARVFRDANGSALAGRAWFMARLSAFEGEF